MKDDQHLVISFECENIGIAQCMGLFDDYVSALESIKNKKNRMILSKEKGEFVVRTPYWHHKEDKNYF